MKIDIKLFEAFAIELLADLRKLNMELKTVSDEKLKTEFFKTSKGKKIAEVREFKTPAGLNIINENALSNLIGYKIITLPVLGTITNKYAVLSHKFDDAELLHKTVKEYFTNQIKEAWQK